MWPKLVKTVMDGNVLIRMKAGYEPPGLLGSVRFPPALPLHVARAEAQLGFRLPELLSALYLQLANGGFGPEVIGLEGGETHEGMSLAELYALMRESHPDHPNWK